MVILPFFLSSNDRVQVKICILFPPWPPPSPPNSPNKNPQKKTMRKSRIGTQRIQTIQTTTDVAAKTFQEILKRCEKEPRKEGESTFPEGFFGWAADGCWGWQNGWKYEIITVIIWNSMGIIHDSHPFPRFSTSFDVFWWFLHVFTVDDWWWVEWRLGWNSWCFVVLGRQMGWRMVVFSGKIWGGNLVISWLVVWLPFFIFPYIGLLIIPIDVHLFQRGGPTTNQFPISGFHGNFHWRCEKLSWDFSLDCNIWESHGNASGEYHGNITTRYHGDKPWMMDWMEIRSRPWKKSVKLFVQGWYSMNISDFFCGKEWESGEYIYIYIITPFDYHWWLVPGLKKWEEKSSVNESNQLFFVPSGMLWSRRLATDWFQYPIYGNQTWQSRWIKLVGGWNINFIFPYIGNLIIPIDELIFFRGVALAHQPVRFTFRSLRKVVELCPVSPWQWWHVGGYSLETSPWWFYVIFVGWFA